MFFSWNACGKMQVNQPVQHKTNSTIKQTIMNNAMRDKRAAIYIQICRGVRAKKSYLKILLISFFCTKMLIS